MNTEQPGYGSELKIMIKLKQQASGRPSIGSSQSSSGGVPSLVHLIVFLFLMFLYFLLKLWIILYFYRLTFLSFLPSSELGLCAWSVSRLRHQDQRKRKRSCDKNSWKRKIDAHQMNVLVRRVKENAKANLVAVVRYVMVIFWLNIVLGTTRQVMKFGSKIFQELKRSGVFWRMVNIYAEYELISNKVD